MKTIIAAFVSLFIGFIVGLGWEYTANKQSLDEIQQVAQEACDMRIKTIKFACRK